MRASDRSLRAVGGRMKIPITEVFWMRPVTLMTDGVPRRRATRTLFAVCEQQVRYVKQSFLKRFPTLPNVISERPSSFIA